MTPPSRSAAPRTLPLHNFPTPTAALPALSFYVTSINHLQPGNAILTHNLFLPPHSSARGRLTIAAHVLFPLLLQSAWHNPQATTTTPRAQSTLHSEITAIHRIILLNISPRTGPKLLRNPRPPPNRHSSRDKEVRHTNPPLRPDTLLTSQTHLKHPT